MRASFVSAIPPRLPIPKNDFVEMMASWIDNLPELGLSSSYCKNDLEIIGGLRREIGESIVQRSVWTLEDDALEQGRASKIDEKIIANLHKYYHYLLELEDHGLVQSLDQKTEFLALEWESTVLREGPLMVQISNSLELERANVIWNLAAFEAQQATKQNLTTKPGWNKASKCLQNAASWLEHLHSIVRDNDQCNSYGHYPDMSPTFVRFWQALLLAQAQQFLYQSLTCMKRQTHLAAAKLAAAAVPLYKEVETIAENDGESPNPSLPYSSDQVRIWSYFAKAWGVYMSCKAEYHQSQIDRGKKLLGRELARLDLAFQHASLCKMLCNDASSNEGLAMALNELRTAVNDTLHTLSDQIDTAERDKGDAHGQSIPKEQDLTEIRGEKLVKSEEPLSRLLRAKDTEPIFETKSDISTQQRAVTVSDSNGTNGMTTIKPAPTERSHLFSSSSSSSFLDQKKKAAPTSTKKQNLQAYVEVFKSEMTEIISQIGKDTEELTEAARLALAEVNLPHSLTAYRRELAGGGLPNELWQRVRVIQQKDQIVQLKQDLWELKDAADLARSTFQKIQSQLDFDIDSDRTFRSANPNFEGHDPKTAQRSFRQSLKSYDTLLSSAQEGDDVLFRRLEQLDIEPKYNLLQFSKSQLDRLLPGAKETNNPNMIYNIQPLSDLLAELSGLFQEREDLVKMIQNEFRNYDIVGTLQERVDSVTGSDRDYLEATKYAQQDFDGLRYEIQNNMKRQNDLLNTIMCENGFFVNARERTTNSRSADSCIVMIEDAIEEIDNLTKHLQEGKGFYNVVIPKLDELDRQAGDVSARLIVERLEYEENAKRASQELKDELMAKTLLSSEETSSATATAHRGDSLITQSARLNRSNANVSPEVIPQSVAVSANSHLRMNTVDDEKVATLVAMEFDPVKVVAALEKHSNNVDLALNELLS